VRERDRLVDGDRVLEQTRDERDGVLVRRHAQARERCGHLAEQVVAVAVVGVAAEALGPPAGDRRVAGVDVRAVALARRRDHPEHVVDGERPRGRLRRRHDDRRAAERGAGLDEDAGHARLLGVAHGGRELAQRDRLQVREVLLADARDRRLDLRRQRRGQRLDPRAGVAQLGARGAQPPLGRVQLTVELGCRPAGHAAPDPPHGATCLVRGIGHRAGRGV
jgi:hypothetical protein